MKKTDLIVQKPRYSNVLAAAWMAQKHGMKFKSTRGQNLYWDGGSNFRGEKDSGVYAGEYYYVHPDSLSLLEPVIGDMVTNIGMTGWRVIGVCADTLIVDTDRTALKNEVTIIQRNGESFMWPESEEA